MADDPVTAAVEAAALLEQSIDRIIAAADGDALTLCTLLHLLRPARQQMGIAERAVEDAAARCMPKRIAVEGEFYAERRRGTKRTRWDHDATAAAVLRNAGATTPDAYKARDLLMGCISSPTWRIGVLRGHGIDPDEFAVTQPGRDTVQLTAAADREDAA